MGILTNYLFFLNEESKWEIERHLTNLEKAKKTNEGKKQELKIKKIKQK